MKNDQRLKRFLALVLGLVQCIVLLAPVVNAQEFAPEAITATSLACDAPIRVTMQEESSYWFGNASQATVKLGDPITNISDRESIILDSPIEEGYAEKGDGTTNDGQTSSYFMVDMNWAKINVDTQDVMFYIELPAESTSIRMQSICVSSWKYPGRPGMAYQYLESDGTSWVQGTMDSNGHIELTQGFKGYIRLLVNTASNYEDFKDTTSVQSFGFRIDKFGGSFGPAKLGGMWIVSKGEYYEVSVDGGDMVPLTSVDPLPQPGADDESGVTIEPAVWDGSVLAARYRAAKAESDKVTVTEISGITKLGDTKAYELSSTEGKTSVSFNVNPNWYNVATSTEDYMFYVELPAASKQLRLDYIAVDSYKMLQGAGTHYQYLSVDSTEWFEGIVGSSEEMVLPQGFKGFVRVKMDTFPNYATITESLGKTNLSIAWMTLVVDSIGGDNGALKVSGGWAVSKEESRYISVGGGATVCMTDPAEPAWIQATAALKESADAGQAAATTTWSKPSWGAEPEITMTVGDCVTLLNDGQKSITFDSAKQEGYAVSPATYAHIALQTNEPDINMAKQEIMIYLELPEASSSFRVNGFAFNINGNKLSVYGNQNTKYSYLSVDGTEWVDGGAADANYQFNVPAGFKGYVRFDVTTAKDWWWQNNDGNENWKQITAKFTSMTIFFDQYGADLGQVKVGGLWVVDKADFIAASVDGGNAAYMIDTTEPTWIEATAALKETADAGQAAATTTWSKPSWGATPLVTTTVGDCITPLNDGQKSIIFDSEQQEGYFASPASYAHIALQTNEPTVNFGKQEIMIYLELPEASSSFRVNGFVFNINGNKLSVYGNQNTKYSYLSADGSQWIDGGAADANYQFNVPAGFKGYVRFDVTTAEQWWWQNNDGNEAWKQGNATFTSMTIFFDKYGANLGQVKVGGLWVVNKADFIDASVNGGEAKAMTTYVPEPFVPKAASASLEYAQHLWTAKVSTSGGANKLLDANYVDICNASALRINSDAVNGYNNGGSGAAAIKMDTDIAADQDVLIYVELPSDSQGFRVQNTEVVSYKYTNKGLEGWVADTAGENGQIDLPAGFKGYVRLDVNTDHVNDLTIAPDSFGGNLGYLLLGGVWLASGGDYAYVSVDGANPVLIFFEWFETIEKQPSDFSIVIIPDQQVLTYYHPDKLNNMYQWIADQIEPENVQMVLNLGDMTETNSVDNWQTAKSAYEIIAGKAPFICVPGNHDYEGGATSDSQTYRDLTNMNTYFPLSMFREMETYGGSYSEDKGLADDVANTWQIIEYDGYKYLLMALEFGPRDSVLAWAGDVIAAHPDYQTIIFTHGYLNEYGEYLDGTPSTGSPTNYQYTYNEADPANDADGMWDKLVSKYENIVMVLSGHVGTDDVVVTSKIGDHGNEVKQFLIDAQWLDMDLGGLGMVAMMNFSNNGQTVEFTYYSTDKGKYMNSANQFTFTLPAQENREFADAEQWNVVLQDNIAANFCVRVSESICDTADIAVTFDGETVTYPVAALTAGEDGTYRVTANVAAAQMNDDITVQVVNGDNIVVDKTYTICQYINTILGDSYMEKYHEVAKELLNYGGAAQVYFEYNTDNLVNEGLDGVGANDVPEKAKTEMVITGEAEGISFYGASLVLENKVAVRFYFTGSGEDIEGAVTVGNMFYVEKADIMPQDLDEAVTVEVAGLTVSYSPMNYMVRMSAKGSANLKALLKALYNYHLAAEQLVMN